MEHETKESLINETKDPLIDFLNKTIVYCVKLLAVLMVIVIIWMMIDVMAHIYDQTIRSLPLLVSVDNLVVLLGSFMAVLIGIEIFLNIIFYLKKDAIHAPLVLATALTAVARKVIILDYTTSTPLQIMATAAVVFAVGVTYWLITKCEK